MSRLKFAASMGAEPHTPYNAWSYVNHEAKFVLFGAWSDEEEGDRQKIFSETWSKNAKERRPASYIPSLRHLELVLEEGYALRTFRQHKGEFSSDGIPTVKGFDAEWEVREAKKVGRDYFAVRLGSSEHPLLKKGATEYWEGGSSQVIQTTYERSPEARQKCLDLYGVVCEICKVDFGTRYGEHGKGFIHVHHKVPVSERGTRYKVDPETDLVPVCPNCHAMLHRRNKLYTVEQIKEILGSTAVSSAK